MQIQRVQYNNNNKPSFGALMFDNNMKPILNKLSLNELQEIKQIGQKIKDTKYYDLLVENNLKCEWIEPCFIPKNKECTKLVGRVCRDTATILDDKFKLIWRNNYGNYRILGLVTFDFESSYDAKRAKEIADSADIDVYTVDYTFQKALDNLLPALKAWADVCTDVLEKSMTFKNSGKPKVLTQTEQLIEDLMSMPKEETSPETIKTLKNYFKNNPDYGNLYTADDMLELLRNMYEEDILSKKNILTTPIKEGDSSILMYITDIMPTADNSKKYDKILKILSKVQGINYNYKDKNGVSFLEKVMMSENSKLLDLIKDKQLEYSPELDYVYENIQNPEFRENIKKLNIILKNTDGLTAKDIKSELQGIAFQNTVRSK